MHRAPSRPLACLVYGHGIRKLYRIYDCSRSLRVPEGVPENVKEVYLFSSWCMKTPKIWRVSVIKWGLDCMSFSFIQTTNKHRREVKREGYQASAAASEILLRLWNSEQIQRKRDSTHDIRQGLFMTVIFKLCSGDHQRRTAIFQGVILTPKGVILNLI